MTKKSKMPIYKIGNVVILNSGGVDMTVTYIIGTNRIKDTDYLIANYSIGDVVCEWFESEVLKKGVFNPFTITIKDSDKRKKQYKY